jgi:acyl-CoA synthetase (AMP-forming)/AMP-acid ligase II
MLDRSRSVPELLRATAAAMPRKAAVVDDRGVMTYVDLDRAVDRLAVTLGRRGVVKGDRVAYLFWNQRELLITHFAVLRIGATVVPLNSRLTADELAYQLSAAKCCAFLFDASLETLALESMTQSGLSMFGIVAGPKRSGMGLLAFDDAIGDDGTPASFEAVDGEDECGIWFTSGTTGRPKGAIVRHRSSVAAGVMSAIALSLTSAVRSLAVAPMFHRGAMDNIAVAIVATGGTQYLFSKLTPRRTLDLLEQHQITLAFIVPTVAWQILKEPGIERIDLSRLNQWVSASAPLPVATQCELEERLGLRDRIVSWYGITEMVFVSTCDPKMLAAKRSSVGLPAPANRIAIFDDRRGRLGAGEIGEVIISGPTAFSSYLGDDKAAREATIELDGALWYRSGDLGSLDEDGYLTIKDRKKDMIITGGENVYASEVEAALVGHPHVREGAIVGVPDEQWGEVVVAVIVHEQSAQFDQAEIMKCFAALANYKRPKRIICLEALPRNSLGKIQKEALRAAVCASLQLQHGDRQAGH